MFGMQHQRVPGKEKIVLYGARPRTSETVGIFRRYFVIHVTTKCAIRNQHAVSLPPLETKELLLCTMRAIKNS